MLIEQLSRTEGVSINEYNLVIQLMSCLETPVMI